MAVILLGMLLAMAGCQAAPERIARSKRTLYRFPPDARVERIVTSQDGGRQASVLAEVDGQCRVLDTGIPHRSYRACGRQVFAFSPGAPGRLFYDALDETDRPWLVVDGMPIAMADVREQRTAWGRSGVRWGAAGTAPDAGEGGDRRAVVAVDGLILGPWAGASRPAVSDDDTRVAVVVQQPDSTLALLTNGVEQRRYPAPASECGASSQYGPELDRHVQLRFLRDGRLMQVVPDPDGWAVYRDGERLAAYPVHVPIPQPGTGSQTPAAECEGQAAVLLGSLVVAEDAPVAAWWERSAGAPDGAALRWRVTRDGAPASSATCRWPAPAGDEIALSPDGRHVGFTCAVGEAGPMAEVYAVLDDQRFGPYRKVWGIGVSPDGRHLTYAAATGDFADPWRVYRDGVPLSRRYRSIWPPRFSPDGRHVAWEALIDREGHAVVGVDGVEVSRSEGILSGPLFPAADRVAWVMMRGRRVVRLDLGLR